MHGAERTFRARRPLGFAAALVACSCACENRTLGAGDEGGSESESAPEADLGGGETSGYSMFAGGRNTCQIFTESGGIRCWGQGTRGIPGQANQDTLGDDEVPNQIPLIPLGSPVVSGSMAGLHICIVTDLAAVRCWGGDGGPGSFGYPVSERIGDDEYPTATETLELGRPVTKVVAADSHTCALLDDRTVKCFGGGGWGQLGYGSTESIGDDAGEVGPDLPAVSLGEPVADLFAGGFNSYSCAILESGALRCWGWNGFGVLGLGRSYEERIGDDEVPADVEPIELAGGAVVQVALGATHLCGVHEGGELSCWGEVGPWLGFGPAVAGEYAIGDDEAPAAIGNVPLGAPAVEVTAGIYHSCARLEDGGVKCWGLSTYLGYGDEHEVGDDEAPAEVATIDLGGRATRISSGWYHTCASLESGDLRCWGQNSMGQLGLGNTEDIGDDEVPAQSGPVECDLEPE